jgi:hypothetical protein
VLEGGEEGDLAETLLEKCIATHCHKVSFVEDVLLS